MAEVLYGIFDTGYAKSNTTTGTQFTRINSGGEIEIPATSMTYNASANSDEEATPTKTSGGVYDISEINTTSVANRTITLRAVFKRSVTAQKNNLQYLLDLVASKGVKVFYYQSTTDGYNTTPNIWGSTDTDHSTTGSYTSGTTPHLHVFVKEVRVTEDNGTNNALIRAQITLVETA